MQWNWVINMSTCMRWMAPLWIKQRDREDFHCHGMLHKQFPWVYLRRISQMTCSLTVLCDLGKCFHTNVTQNVHDDMSIINYNGAVANKWPPYSQSKITKYSPLTLHFFFLLTLHFIRIRTKEKMTLKSWHNSSSFFLILTFQWKRPRVAPPASR